MMDYKTTLEQEMQLYPTLFPDEAEFLRHIFFVNGNGFCWVKGELVSDDYNIPFEQRLKESRERREKYEKDHYDREHKLVKEFKKQGLERVIRKYEPHICHSTIIYPLCEYSTICNLPDDIQDDWLLAAQKALRVAKKLKKTKNDRVYLKQAKKRIKQLKKR